MNRAWKDSAECLATALHGGQRANRHRLLPLKLAKKTLGGFSTQRFMVFSSHSKSKYDRINSVLSEKNVNTLCDSDKLETVI